MSRKMTHEEFISRVSLINPGIEVVSQYDGYDKKVRCHCFCHDYYWETTPAVLLRGGGCHKCSGTYRRTPEEFVEEMKNINPNIEILSSFTTVNEKVQCKCLIDGNEWTNVAANLLGGNGCPACASRGRKKALTKNHDEFIERLRNITDGIEIIGEYIKANEHIKCKCLKCEHEWSATPNHLIGGRGCPECAKEIRAEHFRKSHEIFIDELKGINPNVEILSTYHNSSTKVNCRCLLCGHEWDCTPGNLLNGRGCAKCAHKATSDRCRKPHDTFVTEIKELNPKIEIQSKYVTNKQPVKCYCAECGHVWWALPAVLLRGSGCPACSMTKGERKVSDYLLSRNIAYTYEKEFDGLIGVGDGNLSYDFYLPSYNLLIEYQGQFHDPNWKSTYKTEDEIKRQLEHDRRKREYAASHSIDLLEIWYWDYDNVESILEQKLSA